jgi:putative transposase
MPRTARLVAPGLPHHVYLRGNNRRRLFSSFDDRLRFLRCLAGGLERSACELHQLTLMNNHVHLIAVPPTTAGLSELVARTCQRYAQTRNAVRNASGKLFEERFHSKILEDDEALMAVTLYNDANGFRAGLSKEPFGHEWSTAPLHAGLPRARVWMELWRPSPWYRGLGADGETRAARYRALITDYVARPRPAALEEVDALEREDLAVYRLRVERPDRSLAREQSTRWPRKG